MANHKQLIMVVDDREINRMMLKAMLSDTYNVAEAGNGQEALESLKQYGTSVKAILLDLIMPVMDGHTFLTAIKDTPYANVPVIILTGADDLKVEEQSLKDGASDFISKPYQPMVLKRRLQNAIDHSSLTTLHLIQHVAEHDPLTDLYNRGYFFLETHKMLVSNPGIRFTFIRCDIERFHNLNSYWGDEGGNAFLKYLSEFFRQQEEQYSYITYGRITADVFCMCIPSSECDEGMILKALQDRITKYNSRIFIKPILGIYEIDENETAVEQIYARASAAAQKCKSQHMQNIWHFDDKMRIEEMDEEEIISEMKEALETGQFVAYYQPKYSLKTNRMYGAEALVRWISPDKGIISPGKFIPVFEKNGFIVDLDLYMWNTVAAQLRTWLDAGYHPTPISVNISRVSINNPQIVQVIADIVKKNNIPPSLFSLEITESAYMDNPEIMTDIVKNFQKNGFTVMMDDFGSGYSSLNTLKNIPVDILKIDMKFIEGDDQEGKGRIILSSVIRMAGWLGMPVIVEGVETEYQANFLRAMGCGYIQGYFYARPMPVKEYEKILVQNDPAIEEPFEEVKAKVPASMLWTQDSKTQAIFNQVHFPAGVCSENHTLVYPILVNSAYLNRYDYGTNIMDAKGHGSIVKDPHENKIIYEMLNEAYQQKKAQIKDKEETDENGKMVKTTFIVDYLFSVNNQKIYYFAIYEE